MPRRKAHAHHHQLAQQVAELAFAAPQVIAHRTMRMATAGPSPSRRDQAEFMRMGSEKVVAFYQSWANMWMSACTAQMELLGTMASMATSGATAASDATMRVLTAGMTPVHQRAVSNARRLSVRRRR